MLITEINDQIREWGGIRRTRYRSQSWFDSTLIDRDDKSIYFYERTGLMHLGKLHHFKYTPKLKNQLEFYDKYPVVLMLGTTKGVDGILEVGVNINFLPYQARFYFLNSVYNMYDSQIRIASRGRFALNAYTQQQIFMNYDRIKAYLNRYGLGMAIRSYYPRLRKFTGMICYEEWKKGVLILPRPYQFVNVSSLKIKRIYMEYINRYK